MKNNTLKSLKQKKNNFLRNTKRLNKNNKLRKNNNKKDYNQTNQ